MAELGLFGFLEDDFSEEEKMFGVWPYNWQAVQLFIALATQWWAGMSGATGFDCSVIAVVMDCHGIKSRKRKLMLRKIRAMEIEVLMMRTQGHEQRNRDLYHC